MPVFNVGEELGDRDGDSSAWNDSPLKHIDSEAGSTVHLAGVTPFTAAAARHPDSGEDSGGFVVQQTATMRREGETGEASVECSSNAGATPVLKATTHKDCQQSTDVGEEDADDKLLEFMENRTVAAGPTAAVATAGGNTEFSPVTDVMSPSWNGPGESLGGPPGKSCDSVKSSVKTRQHRDLQSKARSERAMARKTSRQSVAPLGRKKGGNGSASGGSSRLADAPATSANPRNLQVDYT